MGRGRGQVAGVGWAQIDATAALVARGGEDAAPAVAVASDTLLRVSELQALEVADLDFSTSTVTVRRSKTDQEGEGAVLYLGKPTLKRVRSPRRGPGVGPSGVLAYRGLNEFASACR